MSVLKKWRIRVTPLQDHEPALGAGPGKPALIGIKDIPLHALQTPGYLRVEHISGFASDLVGGGLQELRCILRFPAPAGQEIRGLLDVVTCESPLRGFRLYEQLFVIALVRPRTHR